MRGKIEGIGKVTDEVMRRVVDLMPEVQFDFLFDRKFDSSFIYASNVTGYSIFPPTRHPILMHTWLHYGVKNYFKKQKPDLFLSFDGYMPLGSNVPGLITIHDLAYVHFPEQNRKADRWYYQNYTPRFAREAKRIITVSEFSKTDIAQHLKVPKEKVSVVYNGVGEEFVPIDIEEQNRMRLRYAEGHDYFLYVGSIHPRKNLERLIDAFDRYKTTSGSKTRLVITGRKGWMTSSVEQAYDRSRHRSDIRFTGYIEQRKLPALIGSAKALCYISLFEGFGLPILEAMASHTPVICSDRNSMKEVADNAAIKVDPDSLDSISSAMKQFDESEELCQEYIDLGIERVKQFQWDRTASQYMRILQEQFD